MTLLPTGFHIELTNICLLKCPGCARTQFKEQFPTKWQNHSLTLAALQQFLNIPLQGVELEFCGNYGDPIYHPDFLNIIRWAKDSNAIITITTNGSYKDAGFWQELGSVLDHRDTVIFSIDGIAANNAVYRKNSNWESIVLALETCQNFSFTRKWKFIPFNYNESSISEAQSLAAMFNMEFLLMPSDRWDEKTESLRPVAFKGEREGIRNSPGIAPQCVENSSHYISAEGYYMPCCYIGDHRFYYKTEFGKNRKEYSITKYSFLDIVSRPTTVTFYKDIKADPLQVCKYSCPSKPDT